MESSLCTFSQNIFWNPSSCTHLHTAPSIRTFLPFFHSEFPVIREFPPTILPFFLYNTEAQHMNIIVFLKQVPDLVEELTVSDSGKDLDRSSVKFILSEYDDHALEQAILLKEKYGGHVHALALDAEDVDDALFNASAKGADTIFKVQCGSEQELDAHRVARIYHEIVRDKQYDLILTGVQAIDELDGQVGPILAAYLDIPYVGVVRGIEFTAVENSIVVHKEYPGGMLSEVSVKLPAIIGIQAAMQPPRYVPVAKLRLAMKSAAIEDIGSSVQSGAATNFDIDVQKMYPPESTEHAEMIEGDVDDIVAKVKALLVERGVVR
jgi:electron transfer flavoprotein beta subunit